MKVLFISKKVIFIMLTGFIIILTLFLVNPFNGVGTFTSPKSKVIVLDPGHGGIDGGAMVAGVLEKDINLSVSLKLKALLEQNGYQAVMTREEDKSLEKLSETGGSRYQRDLNARVRIINNNNAEIFLAIHANCNLKRPQTNGSIVFYNKKYIQNKALANCIQNELNSIMYDGVKRTVHSPLMNNFFLLRNSKVPGVIIETAFLSNGQDRALLINDGFQEQIANAVVMGVNKYFEEAGKDGAKYRLKI